MSAMATNWSLFIVSTAPLDPFLSRFRLAGEILLTERNEQTCWRSVPRVVARLFIEFQHRPRGVDCSLYTTS
jgi:hypothetical protein